MQSSCIDARPPGGSVKWVQFQQAALVDVSFHTISPGKRRSAFSSAVILDDHFSDSVDATRRPGNMTMPPEPARPQDRCDVLQAKSGKELPRGGPIRQSRTADPTDHSSVSALQAAGVSHSWCPGFAAMEHGSTHKGIVHSASGQERYIFNWSL